MATAARTGRDHLSSESRSIGPVGQNESEKWAPENAVETDFEVIDTLYNINLRKIIIINGTLYLINTSSLEYSFTLSLKATLGNQI